MPTKPKPKRKSPKKQLGWQDALKQMGGHTDASIKKMVSAKTNTYKPKK